jgi:starch synthase
VAALKLISLLKFEADVIHCHDWQTGLIPFYLKTDFRYSKTLKNAKTIFTIHNLIFQFGKNWWEVSPKKKDYGRSRIPHLSDNKIEYVNFAKRAILSADAISTVSETYREEIMTKNFGQDLHKILKNRKDRLFGIVNGISYKDWNPTNDPGLYKNYSFKSHNAKKENKKHVQKKFGLKVDEDIPMICSTSRMTYQKGFNLIVELLEQLMMMNLQIFLVGECRKEYLADIRKVAKKYPKKIVFLPTHEDCMKYETLSYSGSDFFLMPSHYEPCGVNQLIAMRYGCVPIVRKVGGLDDTVDNYNPKTKKGTGFVFDEFDKFHLFGSIVRALENYFHQDDSWGDLVKRVMQQSYDWEIPAKKYIKLYKSLKKMNGKNNGKKSK